MVADEYPEAPRVVAEDALEDEEARGIARSSDQVVREEEEDGDAAESEHREEPDADATTAVEPARVQEREIEQQIGEATGLLHRPGQAVEAGRIVPDRVRRAHERPDDRDRDREEQHRDRELVIA